MSSFVKFTPISGAREDAPRCYLLEIDQAKILLDCGCDEELNVEYLSSLKKYSFISY